MHCNLFIVAIAFIAYANANPAVEHKFREVVNSNECLKECMKPVQAYDMSLSVFKTANYTNYFLNLDQICDVITNARHCIDNCAIKSNPFALISINAICSEKLRQDAKLLEPCLANVGVQVQQQCVEVCGDYEQINDQLRLSTSTYNPKDQSGLQTINEKTNNACGVMKCSARCAVDNFNRQCEHLSNGQMAGNLIRDIVESVLASHRMDLQVFGLTESVKKESQPECNYLHTADVLFNPVKDMITQKMSQGVQKDDEPQMVNPEQQIRMTANQLYVRIMKKQLQVLDKQLELMEKQENRLNAPSFIPVAPVSSDMF